MLQKNLALVPCVHVFSLCACPLSVHQYCTHRAFSSCSLCCLLGLQAADGGHTEACALLLDAGCPWNLQDCEGYCAGMRAYEGTNTLLEAHCLRRMHHH